jgi:hypothetical protein
MSARIIPLPGHSLPREPEAMPELALTRAHREMAQAIAEDVALRLDWPLYALAMACAFAAGFFTAIALLHSPFGALLT